MKGLITHFILGTLLVLVAGCKTLGSTGNSQSSNVVLAGEPTSLGCGPGKTLYFHWMSDGAATAWQKLAGVAQSSPEDAELTPRTGDWMVMNEQLMEDIISRARASGVPGMAGGGVYLAGAPFSSKSYGGRLMIFRITRPDGKGLSCPLNEGFKEINDQTTGAARRNLPLLVKFLERFLGDDWYVSPRAPDRAQGEQVVFDQPHQGDAELAAGELIIGKTRLELFTNFLAVTRGGFQDKSNYCQEKSSTASDAFHRRLLCQSLAERLSQALASLPQVPLTPNEKDVLGEIACGYEASKVNSPAISGLLSRVDPQVVCSQSSPGSPAKLDTYRACTLICGSLTINLDNINSWKGLAGVSRMQGDLNLANRSTAPLRLNWSTLRLLQQIGGINIENDIAFDGCDTEMALNSAKYLRINLTTFKCLPHFGKLTKISGLLLAGTRGLTSLNGLNALSEVGELILADNHDLVNLGALNGLRVINHRLQISDNATLTSLGPLLDPALYQPPANDANATGFCITRNPRLPPQEVEQLTKILSSKGWTSKGC